MKTKNYRPIACTDYEFYEIAILQRRHLLVRWKQAGVSYDELVRPIDLLTRKGEEFLVYTRSAAKEAAMEKHLLRLDIIEHSQLV